MEIILSNSSSKPIYEQIVIQIKELIMQGKLKPNDPLPSMRKLAKDLHVSIITTQRAYDELSNDGFIVVSLLKEHLLQPKIKILFKKKIVVELKKHFLMFAPLQNKMEFQKKS